ncbi:hypothetical protein [Sodaliphilus sp.]|uniref:hypothetical protein n=1 Tax=Sodaliphilus sp. TaxID=2815818 RepID=UPI00388FFCE8
MNEINNIENFELDAMRQQLNELKERIDRTTTLNEKLLHESIKGKMRGVHKRIIKVCLMGLVGIPAWIFIGYFYHLPWYFTTFTMVMLLSFIIADYFINRMNIDTMGNDMAETARQLVKMKRMRLRQELIGIPVLVMWLAWFMWEVMHSGIDHDLAMGMCVGGGIGACIGACIGINIFLGLQHSNDEMLRQIEELGK